MKIEMKRGVNWEKVKIKKRNISNDKNTRNEFLSLNVDLFK